MKVLDSQLNDGFSSPCAPSLRLFGGSGLTKYISPFGLFLDFFRQEIALLLRGRLALHLGRARFYSSDTLPSFAEGFLSLGPQIHVWPR
jgi:hypothetical protein